MTIYDVTPRSQQRERVRYLAAELLAPVDGPQIDHNF
jgi:hypothetical protein